jgi:hypothetical protein
MSTSTDLKNPKNFILRKVSKNRGTLNINIPLSIVKKGNIQPSDYMLISYEDKTNNYFSRLDVNTGVVMSK